MFRHQVPLAEYPAPVVEVACSGCDRRGRYQLATLLERFGPECGLVDVLRALSQDCPAFPRDFQGISRCKAHYGNLLAEQGRQQAAKGAPW